MDNMTHTIRFVLCLLALAIPGVALSCICNPKPDSDAIIRLQTAAQNGDVKAMNQLAWYYETGYGVAKDQTQSSFLYKSAADKGDVRSERKTALNYELGQGVKYDHNAAVRYYKMSQARDGEDFYQNSTIHTLFQNAKDRHDFSTAFEWLELCAESDMHMCQFELARNYRYQGGVVDVNYAKAMDWFVRSMQSGTGIEASRQEPWAYEIGKMYVEAAGVEQNYATAREWYGKQPDNEYSQYGIGQLYAQGLGEPKDRDKAISWFEKAVDKNLFAAAYALCELTEKNLNRADNVIESAQCYIRTMSINKYRNIGDDSQQKQNAQMAAEKIIRLLNKNNGQIADPKTYFEFTMKSAGDGNAEAIGTLAILYSLGYGVQFSNVKAKATLRYMLTKYPESKDGLIARFLDSTTNHSFTDSQVGFLYDLMVRDGFSQALNRWADMPLYSCPACV